MLPRSYQTDLHHFHDADFLQIVAGFRQLRSAWDELTTASAANDIPGMQEVDEAVVQLVKDCGKKLTNIINLKNKRFPQVLGVPPAQVIVPKILLPANAPPGSPCGLATAVQNTGAGAPNAPTANAPGPAKFQLAQAASPYQIPPPPLNPQGPIQLPLPASGNPSPSGSDVQMMPPPAMRPLKLRLRSSAHTLKISGSPSVNNPQQMFPQVVVNNQTLNNPPQTAGGSNQILAPRRIPKGQTNLPRQCLQILVRQETKSRLRRQIHKGQTHPPRQHLPMLVHQETKSSLSRHIPKCQTNLPRQCLQILVCQETKSRFPR